VSTQQKMTCWAFDTRITDLATNTTLGTATRHDFAAQTIYVPETTRTMRRVMVRVGARFNSGTAQDLDGVRIGIKIGAVAFDDLDVTVTVANNAASWPVEFWRDVTAYFVTNDPGSASFNVQVGVAFATGAAANVNNITAELFVVYDYDDSAATYARTAWYPIQSHSTNIAAAGTYEEVGVEGTAPAPTNQIPQLTGSGGEFENVTGFTLRKRYLVIFAHDNQGNASTITPKYRFDGGADQLRAPLIAAGTLRSIRFLDIIDITGLATNAAHKWEATMDVATRMNCIGAIDVISYEYTASSAVQHVSMLVPLDNLFSDIADKRPTTGSAAERWTAAFDVQEPATLALRRCGVLVHDGGDQTAATALRLNASGQTVRTYTHGGTARAGNGAIVHRCDHSSAAWAIARGSNALSFDVAITTQNTNLQGGTTGVAMINYTCGKHPAGASRHNRTVLASQVHAYVEGTGTTCETVQTPSAPSLPDSTYTIHGAFVRRTVFATWNAASHQIGPERNAGEDSAAGFLVGKMTGTTNTGSVGAAVADHVASNWFRRRAGLPDRLDVTASRRWANLHTVGTTSGIQANLWLTSHTCQFTVAGTVTIGSVPAADGKTVKIFAVDSAGRAELVATVVTAGGAGAFSATVPGNVRTYFASYVDGADIGRSADGTPSVSTFNITVGSTSAPVITNNTTTMDAIRDQIAKLIKALVPTSLAGDKFDEFRDEADADFEAAMQGNAQNAFRRYQVRHTGEDSTPESSNTDVEAHVVTFEIKIAYAQTARAGVTSARARDKLICEDQHLIQHAIGMAGYANFTGSQNPNASWMGDEIPERTREGGIDFLILRTSYRFYRRMVP